MFRILFKLIGLFQITEITGAGIANAILRKTPNTPLGVLQTTITCSSTIRDDNPIHNFPFDNQELQIELLLQESCNKNDSDFNRLVPSGGVAMAIGDIWPDSGCRLCVLVPSWGCWNAMGGYLNSIGQIRVLG